MAYFSRLTDIVTCNLTGLLRGEAEPATALRQVISEMEEGLAGARRSVTAANGSADRLRQEIDEHRQRITDWTGRARQELSAGREDQARLALLRKSEVDDVIAGLEQQREAALRTHEHLSTTLRALEARLQEARRKLHDLETGSHSELPAPDTEVMGDPGEFQSLDVSRARQIDTELESLRQSLAQTG